jgi:adenylate kinase
VELGSKARVYMEQGQLVPDDIMAELVIQRLAQNDCRKGFILDGFPRTIFQAERLDDLLNAKNMALDSVIDLKVSDESVIQRLSNRRLCAQCGADYNLLSKPPQEDGRCDRCGGSLYQREDDREETIVHRLQVYHRQTEPLEVYYRNRGALLTFDAEQGVEEVNSAVADILMSLPSVRSPEGLASKDDST